MAPRQTSGRGGRPARPTRPTPSKNLEHRLADSARYRAGNLGYRVTGLKGYHEMAPARGIAYFSLTRGCLIVAVNGEDSAGDYYPTYALGDVAWAEAQAGAAKAMARARGEAEAEA